MNKYLTLSRFDNIYREAYVLSFAETALTKPHLCISALSIIHLIEQKERGEQLTVTLDNPAYFSSCFTTTVYCEFDTHVYAQFMCKLAETTLPSPITYEDFNNNFIIANRVISDNYTLEDGNKKTVKELCEEYFNKKGEKNIMTTKDIIDDKTLMPLFNKYNETVKEPYFIINTNVFKKYLFSRHTCDKTDKLSTYCVTVPAHETRNKCPLVLRWYCYDGID